jgi:hypothetical protein
MQSLAGFLNFCAQAQPAARAFIRRIYTKIAGRPQHHKIDLLQPLKADLEVWKVALLTQRVEVPWLDHLCLAQADFDFFTDSSGESNLGCGVYFQGQWCALQWPEGFFTTGRANMFLLEMIPVVIALETFATTFATRRVRVYSDNMGVVSALNSAACTCPATMPLVRLVFLRSMQYNYRITASYIPTKRNTKADNLSRLKVDKFFEEVPEAQPHPFQPPTHLWPISKAKLRALRLTGLSHPHEPRTPMPGNSI